MEQLSNMPVWAQMLSMGSFMFASGVLMTRIPLAPAIILSFFYLYGVFSATNGIPSFCLQRPGLWLGMHIGLPLLLLLVWGLFLVAASGVTGDNGLGMGMAGAMLLCLFAIIVGVCILGTSVLGLLIILLFIIHPAI